MFEYRIGATWYQVSRYLKPTTTYFDERELGLERNEGSTNTFLYGDAEVLPFAFEFEGRLVFDSPADLISDKNWHQTNFPNVDRLRYQGREWTITDAYYYFTYAGDHRQANVKLTFIPETYAV